MLVELAALLLAGQFALCSWMALTFAKSKVKADYAALERAQTDLQATLKNHGDVLTSHALELRTLKQARTKGALGG